jgi:hypothetical protein
MGIMVYIVHATSAKGSTHQCHRTLAAQDTKQPQRFSFPKTATLYLKRENGAVVVVGRLY